MITNTGKSILAKYMLGQISDYASYIAIGCGAKPIDADTGSLGNYATKESLDYETLRVPIVSRGLITESGISKVVLTGELPTENRYEISEIGVFSSGSNPAVGAFSSRHIYQFTNGEAWTYNSAAPELVTQSIDDNSGNIDQSIEAVASGAFYLNSDNAIFNSGSRAAEYERPRNQNTSLMIVGDSAIPLSLTGVSLDLDNFSINDELRLAFSVVSQNLTAELGSVSVTVEFAYSADDNSPKATLADTASNAAGIVNKYFVFSKKLKDLTYTASTADFSWASVKIVRVSVATKTTNGTTIAADPSDDFYVALDGLRIENAYSNNPGYGMIGYSVMKTDNAVTITKNLNSPAYIEFRFALDVN